MRNFIRGKALFDRRSALRSTIFKNLFAAWHVLTEKNTMFCLTQRSIILKCLWKYYVSLQIPWEKTSCFFNISIHWFSLGSEIYGRKVSKMHHILWVPLRDIRRTNSIVMPILYLLTCLSSWRIIHPFALPFLSSLHVFWHSFYGNFITLTLFFRNLSVYKAWDCDSVGVRLSWLSVAQLHALVLICYISP